MYKLADKTKKIGLCAVSFAAFLMVMNGTTVGQVHAGSDEACTAFTKGIETDSTSWNDALDTLIPLGNASLEDFEGETVDTPISGSAFAGFSITSSGDVNDDWDGAEFGTNPLSGNIQGTVRHRDLTTITFTTTTPVIGFGINIGDMHDIDVGNDTNVKVKFGGTLVWDSTASVGGNVTGPVTNTVSGEVVTVGNDLHTFFGYYDPQNSISTVEIEYSLRNKDNWTFDDVSLIFADETDSCDPSVQLNKSSSFNDENNDGFAQAGETVSYAFTVTNTGNTVLTDVTIVDPLITITGGPIASMNPADIDSATFTGVYTLLQSDIDAGYIENSAIVQGTPSDVDGTPIPDVDLVEDTSDSNNPGGDEETETPDGEGNTNDDPTDDPTVEPLTPLPATGISLQKASSFNDENADTYAQVGETITYTFNVCNTADTVLTSVIISDPLVAVVGGPVTLAAGACDNTTFTAAYSLTQDGIDAGYIENTATATGAPSDSDGDPFPGLALVEDTSDSSNLSGDELTETPDGEGNVNGDSTDDPTVEYLTPAPDVVEDPDPVDPTPAPVDQCSIDGTDCLEELAETGNEIIISALVGSAVLLTTVLTSVQLKRAEQ